MKANKRVQEGDPYSGDSRMSTSICWPSSCLSFSLASSIPDAVFMATVFFYNKLEFLHIDLQKGCSIPRIDATNNLILVNSCSILGEKKKRKLVTEVSLQNETLISYTNISSANFGRHPQKLQRNCLRSKTTGAGRKKLTSKSGPPFFLSVDCGVFQAFVKPCCSFPLRGNWIWKERELRGRRHEETHTHTRTNLFGSSHKPEKKEHCKIWNSSIPLWADLQMHQCFL